MSTRSITANADAWLAHCDALGLEPVARLKARDAVLANADSLECSLYRSDDENPDAEELDLGDAVILLQGSFQFPEEWDAQTREDYLDGSEPQAFSSALLEPFAAPGSRQHFLPRAGDYLAASQPDGRVQMYYLYECLEQDDGCHCVLIREDDDL